jgi:capsular exopolysaccharide synthesis family protein
VTSVDELAAGRPVIESRRGAVVERGLPDLLEALRWRWKLTVLIALAFTIAASVYVESLPSQYDGKAIVAIGPRPEVSSAGADTVRVLAPKFVAYATARSTIAKIAPRLDEELSDLDGAIEATIGTDTGNITITARRPSPVRAANAANAFARDVVAFAAQDPLVRGQLVARALPPDQPAAPPRRLLEGAALLVGLILGASVSVLLERARPRLRSWRDISRLTGRPVVGRIPSSRIIRQRTTEALADPVAGSAFRALRANLEPQLSDAEIDNLLVTSPGAGNGKSTVSALVAEAFARVGMRVLLVDGDLRRPRIGEIAHADTSGGLSALLRGKTSFEDAVRPGWTEGLWILPTAPDVEARDLLPKRFPEVMRAAREAYDLVVVDTPPLLETDDARSLAPMARAVLLVVAAGETAAEVNEAIVTLESLRAPLLGIVGNRLKESRAGYGAY